MSSDTSDQSCHPIFVTGPTAAGKTAFAIRLAQETKGEVVNADAFQLYRGMDVITAAPTLEERSSVPHHLFGTVPISDEMDAAQYAAMALPVIEGLMARKCRPIVVGGSGLYVKALTHGLDDLPPADPQLRASLAQRSLAENVAQLRDLDPQGAEAMNLGNPRYVERALELCLLTGRPASLLKTAWSQPRWPRLTGYFLQWPREALYERINARVEHMINAGAMEEIAALRQQPQLSATATKAIDFGEIAAFLDGEITREQMVADIQQATRRFAKRQGSWFRRESWLTVVDGEG